MLIRLMGEFWGSDESYVSMPIFSLQSQMFMLKQCLFRSCGWIGRYFLKWAFSQTF